MKDVGNLPITAGIKYVYCGKCKSKFMMDLSKFHYLTDVMEAVDKVHNHPIVTEKDGIIIRFFNTEKLREDYINNIAPKNEK